MQHDLPLRATARAIYDACYPSEEWTLVVFDEAERCGTVRYRQSVEAARLSRTILASTTEQLVLPAIL